MKWNVDLKDKSLKPFICILAVGAILILFEKFLGNISIIFVFAAMLVKAIVKLISPFIVGFCIAYLLNAPTSFIERTLFPGNSVNKKLKRFLSMVITDLIIFGGIVWIMAFFIPEFIANFKNFVVMIPKNADILNARITEIFDQISFIDSDDAVKALGFILQPVTQFLNNILNDMPGTIKVIAGSTYGVVARIFSFFMGFILSFYMLFEKEDFSRKVKKITYTMFNKEKADKIEKNVLRINGIFKKFIVGKSLDSLIIGIICFVCLHIMKIPYNVLISVIVGITNMIPYFGPFMGGIPAVLIVLLSFPSKTLFMIVFIIILQQFDGNILGPKILGDSIGLSPIWIIFSIIIGGALGGVIGMFIGVPVFASVKLFFDEYIDSKFKEKYKDDPPNLDSIK